MTRASLPIAFFLLVAAVTRADEPSVEWGPNMKGLRMSARLERPRYRAGEPIVVDIVIKNTSKELVFLGFSAEDTASFEIVVSYTGGGLTQAGRMPLTKYGTWRFTPFDASKNIQISLKGGEERRYRFPLNRMYDMTLDGDYSIVVNRTVPGGFRYDADGHMLAIEGNRPAELMSNESRVVISDAAAQK
jgi:hypothetical protein